MAEIPIDRYNRTELVEIIRRRTNRIVRRSLPIERLQELVSSEEIPIPLDSELAGTMQSRYRLELFVVNNWAKINSQLPCIGPDRGRCTVYLCSEGRHLECYISVPPHLLV